MQGWAPLYLLSTYKESTADDVRYEQPWGKNGEYPATLPLNTAELMKEHGLGVIRTTPMGATLTFEMAKAAIEGEKLGSRPDETDFLAMSHSSTDYIGHRYGTFAVETEDAYLRLDKDLADFFAYLDKQYGRDGYLFIAQAGVQWRDLGSLHLPRASGWDWDRRRDWGWCWRWSRSTCRGAPRSRW